MARYEVTAYGAHGNGIAFDHGDHMLDIGWEASFDNLSDALAFIKTRKSGWAFTDDSTWVRRAVKELYLYERSTISGKFVARHEFKVTAPRQLNVEVRSTGV